MNLKLLFRQLAAFAFFIVFAVATNAQTSNQLVTPPNTIKEMMTGMIEPITNALWAVAMDENIPESDSDWQALENQSIQLLTVSAALSLGGSGPMDKKWAQDEKWKIHLLDMIKIGKQFLQASRDKNYQGLLDAGEVLIEPCGNCHADFPVEN